jgi:NUMOD3 motif
MPFQKGNKINKGRKLSKEHKRKLSEAQMGISTWNKGLTKETDERVRKQAEEHIGYKHTKESIRKIAEGSKNNKHCLGIKHSEETKNKWSEQRKGQIHYWKGGCDDYWHKKAWELFGHDFCENCYMNNEDHKQKWKHRLEMHNTLEPKDYKIMESNAWMTLCKTCHTGLEATLKNNKILYRKWDL